MKKALELVLRGGAVARYHTKTLLKPEDVAQHSYVVAWIATVLSGYQPTAALVLAALAHDLPEYVLGDMPGPTKRRMGLEEAFEAEEDRLFSEADMPNYYAMLTERERKLLKLADYMSGLSKCAFERRLGNLTLASTERNYHRAVEEQLAKFDAAEDATLVATARQFMNGAMYD